jgi:acetyl-CoA carboxylase carboxyl transferase subunit alpha
VDLLEQGIIDRIVPEPPGGAHRNPEMVASTLKKIILEELKSLTKLKPDKLVEKRVEKFSKMGAWKE